MQFNLNSHLDTIFGDLNILGLIFNIKKIKRGGWGALLFVYGEIKYLSPNSEFIPNVIPEVNDLALE